MCVSMVRSATPLRTKVFAASAASPGTRSGSNASVATRARTDATAVWDHTWALVGRMLNSKPVENGVIKNQFRLGESHN